MRFIKRSIPIIVLLLFIFSATFGQEQQRKADSLVAKAIPLGEHGMSVLVAQRDKVLYSRQAGYAVVNEQQKVDEGTIFRIGSVSKQFTASAILKLVEMGKMNLKDPLNKYILDFPGGEKVTIHHLLTHTSGIKSYTNESNFLERVTTSIEKEKLVDEIKSLGYDFEPGEEWKYNNSAYFILGYLVETVSEMSYEKFLIKHFFKPAEMKNTGVYSNSKKYKNEALGYSMQKGGIKDALDWDMTWAGGAGNLYSTADDLLKWNKALFGGQILNKENISKAHTKVKLNDGADYPYGYGWGLNKYRGQERIGHSGGLNGFLSYLAYYPEIDATVIVLSNCSPAKNLVPASFAEKLTDIFFHEDLETNKEITLDASDLEKYVGRYEYPGSTIMNVTLDDGHLFARLTGQNGYEIFPKGEHVFFWKVVNAEITFLLDGDEVVSAMHKQSGHEFKAAKLESKQPITLSADAFSKYAGEYDLVGKPVKVWADNGLFYTQIEGQPAFQIVPETEEKFFMTDMAVEIEFEITDGITSGLVIHQAGKKITASKIN
ncbi:serine hydrolase [Fulvivirga sp. M361]|uniref:serine hydrolase n=1 Tax=Fulvivirga sp. M361 TaxID=2594266 RepID=UPI0016232F85|nr:serine hydrolase [Fulvivirga sp. M361]